MFVDRFFVEGLAHASYLFGDGHEAAVVDPKRDVQDYLDAAARRGARITAILETHPHADFVSGHVELAAVTGAPIYVADSLPATYPHRDLRHGEEFSLGAVRVVGLDTPGHSPDSMSFLATHGSERALFTGDLLFVGDVGRPDLRDMHADPRAMAAALYRSLHEVVMKLPDDTVVYPAHGAGSLCGRRLGSAPSTTIGAERLGNWALAIADPERFVDEMVANLPHRPLFFFHCPFVNLAGAAPLDSVPRPDRLPPEGMRSLSPNALLLDLRTPDQYAAAHARGSLNVGVESAVFSTWVGSFALPDQPLVAVAASADQVDAAWLELARIGYERLEGWLPVDPAAWHAAGLETEELPQIEPTCIDQWVREGRVLVDVRSPAEVQHGGIEGALSIPLTELERRIGELPNRPVALMCGSGYRSSLAAGLLFRAGRRDVVNLRGGYSAYRHTRENEPDSQDLFCRALFDRMPVTGSR